MINEMLTHSPDFKYLLDARSVGDYLEPAFAWNPNVFSHRDTLQSIIIQSLIELYLLNDCEVSSLKAQFQSSWSTQTGEHIWIPRVREKSQSRALEDGSVLPSHNSMVFQGAVFWSALNAVHDYEFSVSMATGRVPANNSMSGAYLEASHNVQLIRIIPAKWHSVPQLFIPSINDESLLQIFRSLAEIESIISTNEYSLWNRALNTVNQNHNSFVDQIALIHSFVMSSVVPIKQLTIESEGVAVKFLIQLLHDKNSLTYYIFSHTSLLVEFLKIFSGINTGWQCDQVAPFLEVNYEGRMPRFVDYAGDFSPIVLIQLLKKGLIFPKGVLKFFLFMVEGGLLSVGGMCQRVYCTEIRDRAIRFLDSVGEEKRANVLGSMPTQIATITPCWGVESDGRLTDVLDCVDHPFSMEKLKSIVSLGGEDALKNALRVLYPFFTGKTAPL